MTNTLTKLDISLHERLDLVKDRLAEIRGQQAVKPVDLEDRFNVLGDRLDESRDRLAQDRNMLADWEVTELDQIESWRQNKKMDKLMQNSEESRRHADVALDIALVALDEAETALIASAIVQNSAEAIMPQKFLDD